MAYCPNCGKEVGDERFCTGCGAELGDGASATASDSLRNGQPASQNTQAGSGLRGDTITATETNPEAKKKLSIGMIVGVVVILLLLVSCASTCGNHSSNSSTGTGTASSSTQSAPSSSSSSATSQGSSAQTTPQVKSLSAKWKGSTKEGTTIKSGSKKMIVTAKLGSGKSKKVSSWTCSTTTLAAGETSTVTISYEDATTDVKIKCSTKPATNGQLNALAKALDYLDYSAFSKSGLKKQLEFEGFKSSEAQYGVDHCGANWKQQAYKKGLEYLDYSSFSLSGLIDQLEYEGFTSSEASYGAKKAYNEK